jgi:serine-type D-Ala-D-Ala carboxypeptidase (penicillin-binding protein 5/6)
MKLLRFLQTSASAGIFVSLFTSCTGPAGVSSAGVGEIGPPIGGIAAYVVADAHDGHVVLARAADQRRPVASLTKIATAVAVLDFIRNSGLDAGTMMTVPPQVQMLGAPGVAGLQPGDAISIRDALYAAMSASDNYAAETLAAFIGARLSSVGLGSNPMGAFVSQMNGLANRVGCRNTRFSNAHGLELEGQKGYSTAADVARLSIHAMSVPGFSYYCSQPSRAISFSRGGQRISVTLRNTNELLGRGRIDGIKTGTTALAGACLALTESRPATVNKQPDGSTVVIPHRLVVVELGAGDRFGQGLGLLQQGWGAYNQWRASGSLPVAGASLKAASTP